MATDGDRGDAAAVAAAAPSPGGGVDHNHLAVESQDILRLVMHHLTEAGLHDSCRALRDESGVGAGGVAPSAAASLRGWARGGEWGEVLRCLETLDARRTGGPALASLVADVHEMAILELADAGEVELAHAALRMAADDMDDLSSPLPDDDAALSATGEKERWSSSAERRVHALAALRSLHGSVGGGSDDAKSAAAAAGRLIPPDYYGPGNVPRQKRRDDIARRLAGTIPVAPPSRLVALLQQAVKWQVHTGQMPEVRELWEDDDNDEEEAANDEAEDEGGDGKKKKKKKRGKKRRRKKFDLVLGEVDAIATSGGAGDGEGGGSSGAAASSAIKKAEKVPSRPAYEIKFGKKSRAECAAFLPDGSGLVTGSSDGFVEVWDPEAKYAELRMDLPYQRDDELMTHDGAVTALAVSADGALLATGDSDGAIKVWKIQSGSCLRKFESALSGGAVSCLAFSADGSHVLGGGRDGACREFGLRASRMLKEFRGHTSYVNACSYVVVDGGRAAASSSSRGLLVVTGSADGTVRVWDGRSSECRHVLRPSAESGPGSTIDVGVGSAAPVGGDLVGGRTVHAVLPLHSPAGTMIAVPRGPRAYLLTLAGGVVRTFERDDGKVEGGDFVAAIVSPSNRWLYLATEDGLCCCFDVSTGKIEKTIRGFAEESTGSTGGGRTAEVAALAHHPQSSLLAAYSSEKGQKRGLLTLWK